MPQYQSRPLIIGQDQPVRIPQHQLAPVSPASEGAVTAVADDVTALDTRVSTNETDIGTLETDTTANTSFIAQFASASDYADDAAAATGGVAVGEIYRTGSILKIRVS